jgi:hypothetical protein
MKLEELAGLIGDVSRIVSIAMHRILNIPLEDCTPQEMARIADKLNEICKQEDNGDILLTIAQDTVIHTLWRMRKPNPLMIIQVLLMYGFALGYLYRSHEIRKNLPF